MNDLQRELLIVREKMNAATGNQVVRSLLTSVAQNPQSETFLVAESQLSVSKEADSMETLYPESLRTAGELIQAALLHLQALFCVPGHNEDALNAEIRDRWLFENLTRLKKMLIVAKVLAHRRLSSFKNSDGTNVVPGPCDTPSQIMELWILADEFETHEQPEMRKEYALKIAQQVPFDFLALGSGTDTEATKKRAREFIDEAHQNAKSAKKK